MSTSATYRQQSRAYLAYLQKFVPWVTLPTLGQIAFHLSSFTHHDLSNVELVTVHSGTDVSPDVPLTPLDGHNYYDRSERAGLSPRENDLGLLLSATRDPFWKTKRVPKRTGGWRILHIPNALLKQIQRATIFYLSANGYLHTHQAAAAFRNGCSILRNAQLHRRPFLVVRIDLKDFFPSITSDRICTFLKSQYMHPRLAMLIAGLTTHLDRLPQGAPSSPALSNAICRLLDKEISILASSSKLSYSRYADDILISSRRRLTKLQIMRLILRTRAIISRAGFRVNHTKTRVLFKHQRQMVTGVVVNHRPQPPREFRKRLRAIVNNCMQHGFLKEAERFSTIKGPFAYDHIRPTFSTWQSAKKSTLGKDYQNLIHRLTQVRRRGRYGTYDVLQSYLPRSLREKLPALTQQKRHDAIDFWLYLNGIIGYYGQFNRIRAREYRSQVLDSVKESQPRSTPGVTPSPQPEEDAMLQLWDEILDDMRATCESAGIAVKPYPFKLDTPPPLVKKRLVANSRAAFEQFALSSSTYLVEMHRSGVDTLPEQLREGPIIINELRILRNYFSHTPDDRGRRRAGEILKRHTGQPSLPRSQAAWRDLQLSLMNNMQKWVGSVKKYIEEGVLPPV